MDSAQSEKYAKMTEAPLRGLIIKLAIPTMVSMLVTTLYNLVDTYFVGQLADVNATSAVTVAYALMNIIQAVGFFFGQGSGNYISRALGNKEYEKCKKMAATGFFGAFGAGMVITVLGLIFVKPLALFCGSGRESTELAYTVDYMRIILLGAPVMCSSLVLNNQLRFQGNAVYAMIGLISGAVINVFFDALLVPHFKVAGAAVATVACQCISFAVLFLCTRRFSDNIRYSFRDCTFNRFYFREIFKGGFPSLCRQGIASFMNTALMHCCAMVATEAVQPEVLKAAFGIVSKLMMFISSMMIGFGQGFQPVCGFNYGAGKYNRVKEGFRFCVTVTFIFLFCMSVIFFIFSPEILSFVQASDGSGGGRQVVKTAVGIMRRQLVTLPLMSFVVMSNMMLQTTGNVVGASVLAMSRQGLTLIPAMLLLSVFFGFSGLEWAQALADVISLLISLPFVVGLMRKMSKMERKEGEKSGGGENLQSGTD